MFRMVRDGEDMLHTERSNRDSNPQLSCCEVIVLTTMPKGTELNVKEKKTNVILSCKPEEE